MTAGGRVVTRLEDVELDVETDARVGEMTVQADADIVVRGMAGMARPGLEG